MNPRPPDNRRAHTRIVHEGAAILTHDGDKHIARILNISVGGAGLQMDVRLPDSTEISVEIEDFGLIPARIVRQTDTGGVGVKFEISEEREQQFIRQIARVVAEKRRQNFHIV
ncbi:PilZ domain-containing protein [Sneathiella sp.]|uniref:PilZ domain-containing protein n=1 Tax=Sneathiella sp. TaxID=1964365 RepID=UPI0035647D69